MTRLFDRFVQDMQLRNFSESTIRSYTYALKQLAAYFNKSPELINEQEIKDYFLYNRNVKHWSRAAFSVSISAIKFFLHQNRTSQSLPENYFLFFLIPIKVNGNVRPKGKN